MPTIAVFGGSSPQPGSAAYDQAEEVGRLLAERGFTVATGGYCGTMMAVSSGAFHAGGQVVGVTCDQIEQFRPLAPNEWITREVRFAKLQERLIYLVRHNDGMIVLPGGIGTLSEMALAWSYLQVGEIPPRPLVLLGEQWNRLISDFNNPSYIKPEHLSLLSLANSADEAVAYVGAYHDRGKKQV